VEPDEDVQVPRLQAEVGEHLQIREVLAVGDGADLEIGRPLVDGAEVDAEVVSHGRGPKVRVFKFKRRKDYRRTRGHRTDFTELKIHGVQMGAGASTAATKTVQDETDEAGE
jgi:large subunit ribosomal protein L21